MSRSHAVLLSSALFVGVGSSVALSALLLRGAKAPGPLPREALALPAETRVITGLDVRKLVASRLYKRYAGMMPMPLADIKGKTGLDPEHDIDSVVLANTGDKPDAGVVFVFGTFNLGNLTHAVDSPDHKNVVEKKVGGDTLFTYEDKNGVSAAVVLLNDHAVLLGSGPAVQAVLANLTSGATPLQGNKTLMGLLARLRTGATVWMAGDQTLLSQLPRVLPGSQSGNIPAMNLPALQSVTAVGDLDPMIVFDLQADTADAASAKSLGDLVRGLVALGTMQAAQKPELQGLVSALNVTNDQNHVLLSARLPYEVLDALQKKPAATR
jgi:hypothetical protein